LNPQLVRTTREFLLRAGEATMFSNLAAARTATLFASAISNIIALASVAAAGYDRLRAGDARRSGTLYSIRRRSHDPEHRRLKSPIDILPLVHRMQRSLHSIVELCRQPMRDGEILRRLAQDLPARARLLIDDRNADAMLSKHGRSSKAGRAGANDGNLAHGIIHLLFVSSHQLLSGTTTRIPARTGVKHARTRDGAPSTSTKQSKQTPILQKGVRSRPKLSRDIVITSAAMSAVSTDSPS
jgi:hypothetical protein